jgi:YVTN family beta-propeller protein
LRKLLLIVVSIPVFVGLGWLYIHERQLTDYGPAYHEYAYITNGKSNTVSVIDLRTFQPAKTIKGWQRTNRSCGQQPEERNLCGECRIEQRQRD